MNLCVSDDKVIYNLQGIRNVTWGENANYGYGRSGGAYHITVTYKGSHNVFYYQTEAAARTTFNKIREGMDKMYKRVEMVEPRTAAGSLD